MYSFKNKILPIVFAILSYGALLLPLIGGHVLTDTTLVWIKITGWNLIEFAPLMVLAFMVPGFTTAVVLLEDSVIHKKIILVGLITILAGMVYAFALAETWIELWTNVSTEIRLLPACVWYPVLLNAQMFASIVSIHLDQNKFKMVDDFSEFEVPEMFYMKV